MKGLKTPFDEHAVLRKMKQYLPAQAPLGNFTHHNPLQAFQTLQFHDGLRRASEIFGYKVSLSLAEYRSQFNAQNIKPDILEKILIQRKGAANTSEWRDKVLLKKHSASGTPRIGTLRANWKREYHLDLDSAVHPVLFRFLCGYLDQGISIWNFPVHDKGFLASIKEMESQSFASIFKKKRAKHLLLDGKAGINDLLEILVGDESLFEQYLFDQQFAHQGWSGMVSVIEDRPETLLSRREITLHELITFELLLEIDALDMHFDSKWNPLATRLAEKPVELFAEVSVTELSEVMNIWQEAFEWSYYDKVLSAIQNQKKGIKSSERASFQSIFCMDDRECSLRRYVEEFDPDCETLGTPGFFGAEFYYQLEGSGFYTKVCPAQVTPKYLIKEIGPTAKQTLSFRSAFKLAASIFKPSVTPVATSSFKHMDRFSSLTIENKSLDDRESGLQIGFTIEEMASRVENVLKSIGLVKNFAPIVYVIGHGSSSVNNPHYAAYDCDACAGRPGSVNARAFSYMANHDLVRTILCSKGIIIPSGTQFVGGLHDTARDEIVFYDEVSLSSANQKDHIRNEAVFMKALDYNAKERSRRFVSINTGLSPEEVHEKVRLRSMSLFEPRPELSHATNALCVIGRRSLTKNLFLDRRAFMNSYDYSIDPEGNYLFDVLKTAMPLCANINLEYYFSRVDNQKLGAGTMLPHHVMGLFGVANGIDGDLRPGLPGQMIEIHHPVRILFIVEHYPDVILNAIKHLYDTYEWFVNEWVNLVAVNPDTHELSVFKNSEFYPYKSYNQTVEDAIDLAALFESHPENLPVFAIH